MLSRLLDHFDHTRDTRWESDHYAHSGRNICIWSLAQHKYLWDNSLDVQGEITNCECIWILWELYWQSGKFTNRSALFFNLHQESRVDQFVSFSQEKDWTLNTMNLTLPGLCTHSNLFMTRNKLNHASGGDSLWYMTSNLCDLLMDKYPITQYETNFFECLCFSCKWKRFCSREREV
jgi:hypothetical protein